MLSQPQLCTAVAAAVGAGSPVCGSPWGRSGVQSDAAAVCDKGATAPGLAAAYASPQCPSDPGLVSYFIFHKKPPLSGRAAAPKFEDFYRI